MNWGNCARNHFFVPRAFENLENFDYYFDYYSD